jgi:hypothetical protein
VHLRAVLPDDYTYLRLLETSSDLGPRWRLRGSSQGVLAQFIVQSNADDSRIGIVSVFEADFQHGHAQVAAAKFDPHGVSPLMMLGFGVFLTWVFGCWSFRKLYARVPEFDYPQIASGEDMAFVVEGRLAHHYWLAGRLWDELVLAIHREAWGEHGAALARAEGIP